MSRHSREDGYTLSLLIGYAVAGVVNVAAVAVGVDLLAMATKPFLMLLLFFWAWSALPKPKPAAGRWLVVGTLFAWLGDVLLMGEGSMFFMLGLGGFFVMQVCYIVAFQQVPGRRLVREIPWLVIPFVLFWAGMNWMLSPGPLRIPILLYSVVLVGMSVAALDLLPRLPAPQGLRVFVGSVLFVISDGFIALRAFGGIDLHNWHDAIIMATYIVAQYLIVTGVSRGLARRADGREERPSAEALVPA